MFATLSPQELPIAEKLVLGGIKAVRDAVAEQNKNAVAQQRTPVDVATIDRIATDLLPRVALAAWKDKAAGAVSAGRELRLRDLRAVVTAAKTVTLDDEGRAQLKELRDQLTARLEQLTNSWTEKITAAIASNNVKEALGLLSSPPDITIKVSSEMAATVTALASQALSAEQSPAEWRAIVEVASQTSIRRNIKPTGIPADDESKACALHYAGAIPEIAKLLGMKVPPPPPPARSGTSRPSRGPRRS
jgi:hypothetical protein